jgi:hypothetical protein
LIRKVFKVEFKERDREGRSNGDTYHQYCQRCRLARLEPESFVTWLQFELMLSDQRKSGPRAHLDAYQRQLVNA